MGLFSRKPKVSVEEFCHDFYDSQIFNPPKIGGVDLSLAFWEHAFNSIVESDESFKSIDFNRFREEMTALRIELFGLAWADKFKKEQFTIPQSFFTKRYLEENEMEQIWDIIGEYNQIIASSATMNETGEQIEQMGGRIGRARATRINVLRHNMFVKWVEANIGNKDNLTDEEKARSQCVARVCNRIGVDITHHDCIAAKALAAKLADRLGCDVGLNSVALFRLSAIIFGLHRGAK